MKPSFKRLIEEHIKRGYATTTEEKETLKAALTRAVEWAESTSKKSVTR